MALRTPRPSSKAARQPSRKQPDEAASPSLPAIPAVQVHTATAVRIADGSITGIYRAAGPGAPLALLLNGSLLATAATGRQGAFRIALPALPLTGTVDVLDMRSGRSVLIDPLQIATARQFKWHGWSCQNGHIEGRFTFVAPTGLAPTGLASTGPAPILVQSFVDGVLLLQAFALCGDTPATEREYTFQGPVRTLLSTSSAVTIRPSLGGLELDEPLSLTNQMVGAVGCLEHGATAEARGWAADLSGRVQHAEIELRLNGELFGIVAADLIRPDFQQLGVRDGRFGFALPFPSSLDRWQDTKVQAFLAATGAELAGSPYILKALRPVIGFFDAVEGPFAGGWAVNMPEPGRPLDVEALCDGEVIGAGLANLYRGDVEQAGLPTPWCGFRFLLNRPLAALIDRDITLRVAGTKLVLDGSPRQVTQNGNIVRFLARSASMPEATRHRLARHMTHRTAATRLSIVMPVYNTRRDWLIEALNSVLAQWSGNWELICIDDGSTEPHVAELLEAAVRHDPRIRVMRTPGNLGIARAINFGLRAARGPYVTFMDHDDVIEPDAVYRLAMAAEDTGADLIYSDEAVTTDDIGSIIEVRARPAFSHDYYMSHPYFVHMVCLRTSLAQQLGGWDENLPISADVDFVLRAIEQAKAVAHVPSVLYRWRTHGGSAGHMKQDMVTAAMTDILRRHLGRSGLPATVSPGLGYNEYRLDWPDDGGEVLIVIPTRNRIDLLRTCIDSIEQTSRGANIRIVVIDHESTDRKTVAYLKRLSARHTVMPYSGIFNYALMNNLAVKTHGKQAEYILFLNNDVEARENGWIPRLRSLAGRPGIGAVGPLLLYGDDRVQHAGVLMAFSGAADHAMKFQAAYISKGRRHPGYNCNLTSVRDYSAVTAACLMIRHDVWRQVHGFDEGFVVGFNDTDLCLRIIDAGYKVLYDGQTVLYHHESATRTESKSVDHPADDTRLHARWPGFFTHGDPFYSPLLAPAGADHTLRQDPGCKGRMAVRLVRLRADPEPNDAAPPTVKQARAKRVCRRA